jgi:hypothetical protein
MITATGAAPRVEHLNGGDLRAAAVNGRAGQPAGTHGYVGLRGADPDQQPERTHTEQPRQHRPCPADEIPACCAHHDLSFVRVAVSATVDDYCSPDCTGVLDAGMEISWRP